METIFETRTDYFLRYTVIFPADEIHKHSLFSRDCPCEPDVTFDDLNGWHQISHKKLEKK